MLSLSMQPHLRSDEFSKDMSYLPCRKTGDGWALRPSIRPCLESMTVSFMHRFPYTVN
jgi:hypothetical protein